MDREIYEVCSEVLEKSTDDPEMAALLTKVRFHARNALRFEGDNGRRNYERDQELYLAKLNLERYEEVENEVNKTESTAPPAFNNLIYESSIYER